MKVVQIILIGKGGATVAKAKIQPYGGEQVIYFSEILAKAGGEKEGAVDGIL